MISNDTYITGYDAPCPKCGHVMIEPLARLLRRKDGIIVVECPVHGLFHFRPVADAKLVPGEPREE